MAEQIYKLSPHRDLQCYFFTPSAIAAMSQANETGFVLSGKWRQQFDWAVVEWNRDNVFEHPALRNLPDGDVSGLTLTYEEQRSGCIPVESNLFPTVDWDNLRIWATDSNGNENVYHVPLAPLATPVSGAYVPASGTMTLTASPGTAGARVGLAWLDEHYYYTLNGDEDVSAIAQGLVAIINDPQLGSQNFNASWTSDMPASVTVSLDANPSDASHQKLRGANGNRIGMYGFCSTDAQVWQDPSTTFSGGQFPTTYQVTIDFGALKTTSGIPTDRVRKLRWAWAADLQLITAAQPGTFQQTEFQVTISEWSVTGANRQYSVAGPGSRRIEDTDSLVEYQGIWAQPPAPDVASNFWPVQTGNFSGSKIHFTETSGDSCSVSYSETAQHELYLGTRLISPGASILVSVDGSNQTFSLNLPGEDILVRLPLGTFPSGTHSVSLTNNTDSAYFYFDFLEIVYPSTDLPDFNAQSQLALASDWDTYHSQSLPAERTAWLINKLGFQGRVNHYTGALWFYEIVRPGMQYASATFELTAPKPFTGSPVAELQIGETVISYLILPDDTSDTLTQAFALLINNGTNSVWASASGNQLTITARAMGTVGNSIIISLPASSQDYSMSPSSSALSGGVDGTTYDLDATDPLNSTLMAAASFWRTDLTKPQLNRAAHDWHLAYFTALQSYGLDVVASFSTELMNADPSESTGIAQRFPDGTPVVLNTPAIQTNFSPVALAFWTQVYLDMAELQHTAGLTPYLQFGEVQWWYFAKQVWDASTQQYVDANVGMPFYDDYTKQQFAATYGVSMQIILENTANPSQYPNETVFLPSLIGNYTAAIRTAVQAQLPATRFEVLYPTDTNQTQLNQVVNYPANDWTPSNLNCLKTESFTFTSAYNLVLSSGSMSVSAAKGFANGQRSHLVGIGDAWTPWMKETDLAQSQGMQSVVLFALDQYCLIGYPAPPFVKLVRSQRQG